MGFLTIIFVKLIDPIGFVIVLGISFISREKWIIPVAAVVAAVVGETILTATQYTRTWGRGLIPGLVASGIHAVVCYWLVGLIERKRKEPNSPTTID